jgi:hypothetical protein
MGKRFKAEIPSTFRTVFSPCIQREAQADAWAGEAAIDAAAAPGGKTVGLAVLEGSTGNQGEAGIFRLKHGADKLANRTRQVLDAVGTAIGGVAANSNAMTSVAEWGAGAKVKGVAPGEGATITVFNCDLPFGLGGKAPRNSIASGAPDQKGINIGAADIFDRPLGVDGFSAWGFQFKTPVFVLP